MQISNIYESIIVMKSTDTRFFRNVFEAAAPRDFEPDKTLLLVFFTLLHSNSHGLTFSIQLLKRLCNYKCRTRGPGQTKLYSECNAIEARDNLSRLR